MNKNIYLGILTIVTVACILIGCVTHLGLFNIRLPWVSTGASVNGTMDLDSFTEVDATIYVGDFTIESGSDFCFSYDCNEKLLPAVDVKNGKVIIAQQNQKTSIGGSPKCKLTLYVPASASLSNLKVSQAVGDLRINDLSADNCNVTINVGDCKLNNISGDTLHIESNTGDVKCSSCDYKKVDIDSDIGDVDYASASSISDYEMDLKTDVGDVEVFNEKMGHSHQTSGANGSITVKVDVGGIDIK